MEQIVDSSRWHKLKKRLQEEGDDEDEKNYLSRETIRRREDQKLLNYIDSALYRIEMESIKPSFDVKLQAGLHRGPFRSARSKRDFNHLKPDKKPTFKSRFLKKKDQNGDDNGDGLSGVERRPKIERYVPISSPWRQIVDDVDDDKRYSSLSARYFTQLDEIEAQLNETAPAASDEQRQRSSVTVLPWLNRDTNNAPLVSQHTSRLSGGSSSSLYGQTSGARALTRAGSAGGGVKIPFYDERQDELLAFMRDEDLQKQDDEQRGRATSVGERIQDDNDLSIEMLMNTPFGHRKLQNESRPNFFYSDYLY
jgi:hypothetical protein